jgi:hypothetical protein
MFACAPYRSNMRCAKNLLPDVVPAPAAQALRARLPAAADGRKGGQTAEQQVARMVLLPLPLLLGCLPVKQSLWRQGLGAYVMSCCSFLRGRGAASFGTRQHGPLRSSGSGGSGSSSPQRLPLDQHTTAAGGMAHHHPMPGWLPALAVAEGVAFLLIALGSSVLLLIPRQVAPAVGWVLAYEWTALPFVVLFSVFLHRCYGRGRTSAGGGSTASRHISHAVSTPTLPSAPGGAAAAAAGAAAGSGAGRPWGVSLALFALMLSSLKMIPWWADILG